MRKRGSFERRKFTQKDTEEEQYSYVESEPLINTTEENTEYNNEKKIPLEAVTEENKEQKSVWEQMLEDMENDEEPEESFLDKIKSGLLRKSSKSRSYKETEDEEKEDSIDLVVSTDTSVANTNSEFLTQTDEDLTKESKLVRKPIKGLVNIIPIEREKEENAKEKKQKKEKISRKTKEIKPILKMQVGFIGARAGVGTTYTVFSCATSLSKDYKVAVLEQNSSEHFSEVFEHLNGEIPYNRKMFKYGKVDYFFGLKYVEFISEYKEKYDLIFIDFGVRENIKNNEELALIDRVCVVNRGKEWHEKELLRNYEEILRIDKRKTFIYLFPLQQVTMRIKKICNPNKTMGVPYIENPFTIDEKVREITEKILGI